MYTGNHIEASALTDEEMNIIVDYEEEQQRLGNFERIFPIASNAQHYSKFFEHIRPSNELLARYLKSVSIHNRERSSPQPKPKSKQRF